VQILHSKVHYWVTSWGTSRCPGWLLGLLCTLRWLQSINDKVEMPLGDQGERSNVYNYLLLNLGQCLLHNTLYCERGK
jgi:hypothetical protein